MTDPRLPSPADCLVRDLLDRRAGETPDKPAILFEDGTQWTYAEMRRQVRRFAAGLQSLGVKQGDFVACWLPNGPHMIATGYALDSLGAVFVPLNPAYRGALLTHAIADCGARLMVADAALLEYLPQDVGSLSRVVRIGDAAAVPGNAVEVLAEEALTHAGDAPTGTPPEIRVWDTKLLMYTSGTTGMSKGVLITHVQAYLAAVSNHWFSAEDRALVTLPMYHTGGVYPIYRALVMGGSAAIVSGFSTGTFWQTVRDTQATTLSLLGAMVSFLVRQPEPAPGEDRRHTLRSVGIVPVNADALAFAERFGVAFYSHFGMTEISAPIVTQANPTEIGTCGRARAGVEARVVDENDCEVAHGTMGQLVLRSDTPWAFAHAYNNNPAATAAAWRNGWFHTGDAFRQDERGNFFFVDRLKDTIRRRGENISAFEVEREIMAHPQVADAAVVAVASPHGEDDVLAVVVPKAGAAIAPEELLAFLVPRMAHYMVPRYVRMAQTLPRTPTHKLQKYLLRDLTPDTWDRDAAGVKVKREFVRARSLG